MEQKIIYVMGPPHAPLAYDSLEALLSWTSDDYVLGRSQNGSLFLIPKTNSASDWKQPDATIAVHRVALNEVRA